MSLKEIISIWNEAVILFDSGKYEEAAEKFRLVPERSAKIVFNLGSIALATRNFNLALSCYSEAVLKDPFLAVAYFQRGCTNVLMKRYKDAKNDFEMTVDKMRGSELIDYRQLGLPLKFYASQVLMNLALVSDRRGDSAEAVQFVQTASRLVKDPTQEATIVGALAALPVLQLKLMEIPVKDSIFRPPKSAVSNLMKKDFLGKAKVVSSVTHNDTFVGFEGARKCSSSPSSPSPSRKQNLLTVSDLDPRRGSLTPPPPSRPPPILSQSSNHLQSLPQGSPPQLRGSSLSENLRLKSDRNINLTGSRLSEGSRPPPPNYPPPVLSKSVESSEVKVQRSKPERPPPPVLQRRS